MSLAVFVAGFDIEGIGETTVEKLVAAGFNTLNALLNMTVEQASAVYGFAEILAKTAVGVDNEEFIAGMVACSVPILNPDGQYFASLFIHAPTVRKTLADLQTFVPEMQAAARELSLLLKEAATDNSQ